MLVTGDSETPLMIKITQLSRRWRKRILLVTGLFSAYVAFGFLLLPWLLHNTLTEALSTATHRPVTLAVLKINPLTLSATLGGLEIGTADQPLARFEEIYINFSLGSLWHRAYVFNTIRLQAPRAIIAIDRRGRINFQDIMPANSTSANNNPPPVVVIQSLEVTRGSIDFEDLSRPTPFRTNIATLNFSLRDFTTRRNVAGNYQLTVATDLGETLAWQGSLQVTPFRSEGTLRLGNIRTETIWALAGAGFKFNLEHGLIDISSHYLMNLGAAEPQFRLDGMNMTLRDLQLLRRGATEPVLVLPRLDVSGLNLDWQHHTVAITDITAKDVRLRAARETDGQLDLRELFTREPLAVNASAKSEKPSPPWQITLNNTQLQTASLQLEDRTTMPSAHWHLTPFNMNLKNLAFGSEKPVALLLETGINTRGHAELHGELTLSPPGGNLNLTLTSFDLTDIQPYVQHAAQLQLRNGELNVTGHMDFVTENDVPAIKFSGDAAIQKLHAVDILRNEDFILWEQLAINGLSYDNHTARLTMKELAFTKPYLRFIITPDSITNLSHIFSPPSQTASEQMATTTPIDEKKATSLTTIDQVRITDGTLNFGDQSIKPNFNTGIQQLNGTIHGLSSKELARADVELQGKVDRYAPATIRGKINPLSNDAFTDLAFNFRGIETTAFTPYSGKFAGYKIDKGKLNVELHYLLSKKMLQGENKIVIDQLQLGEKVESPDATGLPVRLAIAILKDTNGVIDLDLPISGRIDDPDFHYGRIVWMALKNIIVKLATAPFRALASLMGGSEEGANQVSFIPGKTALSTEELEKLGKLAQALAQRPALALEVRGTASPADANAIAAAALEQRLTAQPGESRTQKIHAVYLTVYGTAATTLLPPPAPGETLTSQQIQENAARAAETQLLAAMTVSDDELRTLAQERAQAIAAALIEGTIKVDAERVFLLDVDTRTDAGTVVTVPLSLQAR